MWSGKCWEHEVRWWVRRERERDKGCWRFASASAGMTVTVVYSTSGSRFGGTGASRRLGCVLNGAR